MKQRKRKNVNPLPNISLFGTNLDRLLNGQMTRELAIEIDKAKPHIAPQPEQSAPAQIVFKPSEPLYVVMYDNKCACKATHQTFGYFTRRTTECVEGAFVTKMSVVANPTGEKPAGIIWHTQTVPFCPSCIVKTEFYNDRANHPAGNLRSPEVSITDRVGNPELSESAN